MLHLLLIVFTASVVICALLTRAVRDFARARNWVDPARASRHIHARSVPRLGGVAIFAVVAAVGGIALLAGRGPGAARAHSAAEAGAILLPAAFVFLVGLYDDFRCVGPKLKFGAQALAACLLYFTGVGIHRFDLLFRHGELGGVVGLGLTVVWVLLITNAFNLIDGLDGLATGAALFSTIVVFVVALLAGDGLVAILAAALAGAMAGFLRFNFHPATIFLGDCGSLFVGFLLAALALAGSQKASTMVAVAIPVVCFGLPILDVAIAVFRRYLSGRPLFQADSEHIHHRLLTRGFRQRDAVLILYGVSAFFALVSLALLHGGKMAALVLLVLAIGVAVGIPQLRYEEFKEMRRVLDRTASQKRIIENDLRIRRAAHALNECSDFAQLCRILAGALRPCGFDGFGLRLASRFRLRPALPAAGQESDGEILCLWTTAGKPGPGWEMRLELADKDGERCGSLALYKWPTGRPLLLDVNLLSEGFQTALAASLRRAVLDRQPRSANFGQGVAAGRRKAVIA